MKKKNTDDGNLLFFSLPNGGCYELLPKSKIEFYLINGFSFLCWNYRGYGYSKGRTDFSHCKEDALDVFDAITKSKKYNFKKICVMGHSMGGIATSHVAKNREIDLIISDRNFCDIPRIALNLHCGNVFNFLLKSLFIGKTNVIENIMDENNQKTLENKNVSNINKIIIYSPNDDIIVNDCTVKSGLSRYLIKNYIFYKNDKNLIIKSKENFLDLVFNSNEKNLFLNDLIDLIHLHYDKHYDKKNEINNSNDDIPLIDCDDIIKDEYKNIPKLFFEKFKGVCCDELKYIYKEKSIRKQKLFLDSFFNNLLIWGAKGGVMQPNEEDFEFYSYKGFRLIKEACDILDKNNYGENLINKNNLTRKIIDNFRIYFKKILFVIQNLDIDINLNNNINNSKNNLKINNLNDNNKEELFSTEDKESEINTDNTNINIINIINTKIEFNNDLIDDDCENTKIKENKFYQKLSNISGNFKIFKTSVGHREPLEPEEQSQLLQYFQKSGIIEM